MSTLTQPHTAAFAQLWSEFSQGLSAAGQAIPQFAPDASASDLADGYQQFGMLLESAFRWYLRSGDPDFPRFVEINDTPELADNLFAPVRGDATYRLRGDVGSLFDFNISVHSEWGWVGPSQTSGDLGREELQINDDGTFELIISATEHPGNWLPLPPSAGYIQIREYYEDFGLQKPGSWDIMRVGSEGQAPPRAGIEDLKTKLDLALTWARNYTPWHYKTQSTIFPAQPNAIRQPTPFKGGNSHIWYGFGRFKLEADEALIVEFDKPEARLWGMQWLQSPWYENPDMLNHMTSLPSGEIHVDADGRVRMVIAASDPGVPNWLDCAGYTEGYFVTRWIWCEQGPPVDVRVARLAELRLALPAETPQVTPEARAAKRAQRRAHLVHRRR